MADQVRETQTNDGARPRRSASWPRLALVGVLAVAVALLFLTPFSGAIAGPFLQGQPTPTPGPAEQMAVVALMEEDGSGFHGTAFLRSLNGQTELLLALIPPSEPLLPFLGLTEEDIGSAALYSGFCGLLRDQVENFGELQKLYSFAGEERGLHILRTTVDMGLDELLTGENALVVLQRAQDVEPGQPTPTPEAGEQPNLLVCGTLNPDARLN